MGDETGEGSTGPLVVLDATVFMADPACASTAWRILAQATRAWGVRIFVPAVVLVEAVGGYERRIQESLTGLQRWQEKHGRQLDLTTIAMDAEQAIRRVADEYGSNLKQILADIPASILSMPDVSHEELVTRAVDRRKPCDAKGDRSATRSTG